MSRTELLNDLIQKIGAKSYLEIGIHDGANFDAIVCANKVGVDPVSFPWKNPELIQVDTSDSFFARNAVFDTDGFDVIFIDGLHEADQVLRDIKNALKVLSKDGYIVCHDMNPVRKEHQTVPYNGGHWNGDYWKAMVELRRTESELYTAVVDIDEGLGIITRNSACRPANITEELTYENLEANRKEWLNLISLSFFYTDVLNIRDITKLPVVLDCFPYFNERELLELRINLLKDVVDFFVISEADRTHSGQPKDMILRKLIDELNLPADKIIVVETHLPSKEEEPNDWVRENMQRDALSQYIGERTVAIISDADEIMNPDFVKYYVGVSRNNPNSILRIPMSFLNVRADLQVCNPDGTPKQWFGGFICNDEQSKDYTLSEIREDFTRGKKSIKYRDIFCMDAGKVLPAGWHFSWMGDNNRLEEKYKSYAENSNPIPGAVGDSAKILSFIQSYKAEVGATDPLGRKDHVLKFYDHKLLPQKIWQLNTVKCFLLPAKIDHFYKGSEFGESWFSYPNLYAEMVRRFPSGSRFVEIGVWKGRSAAFMAVEIINSLKDIEFSCVDHWEGSEEHKDNPELESLYDIYSRNMNPVKGHYTDIKMPSLQAAEQFADESLDFVFIDASHDYDAVKKDITAWLPKVKKDGVIAGHDCYPNNPDFGGVYKAVSEIFINFKVTEDCWVVEKNNMILKKADDTLGVLLRTYINDPANPQSNFALGMHYQGLGQTASAVSFFIRAAERSNVELFQYESLIRAALCFMSQGIRGLSVRGLLQRAMTILPRRPEAPFLLARWWERDGQIESWVNCYTYASIAEKTCDFNLPSLRTWVEYPGKFGILFEKAVAGWWVGQCEESRDIFLALLKDKKVDESHRRAIIGNLRFMEGKTGKKLVPEGTV